MTTKYSAAKVLVSATEGSLLLEVGDLFDLLTDRIRDRVWWLLWGCAWQFWKLAIKKTPVSSFSVAASCFFFFKRHWSLSFGNFTHLTCSFLTQGSDWTPSVGYLWQIKSVVKRVLFAVPQPLWCARWHRHLQQSLLNLFGIGKYFSTQVLQCQTKYLLAEYSSNWHLFWRPE